MTNELQRQDVSVLAGKNGVNPRTKVSRYDDYRAALLATQFRNSLLFAPLGRNSGLIQRVAGWMDLCSSTLQFSASRAAAET